jgi:hypothetical protein
LGLRDKRLVLFVLQCDLAKRQGALLQLVEPVLVEARAAGQAIPEVILREDDQTESVAVRRHEPAYTVHLSLSFVVQIFKSFVA